MSTSTSRRGGSPNGHRESGRSAPAAPRRHHDRSDAVDTAPPVHFVEPETGAATAKTGAHPASAPSTEDDNASTHHLRSPFIPGPADGRGEDR